MNKKIVVSTVSLALLVSNTISVSAKPVDNYNNIGSYSNCVNPGQFWADNEIDQNKYEAIYLGYCTRAGDKSNNYVILPVKKSKKHKNNKDSVIYVPPVIIIDGGGVQIPGDNNNGNSGGDNNDNDDNGNHQDHDKDKKECKNKNQYKDGTDDCNAGKGND
jgi:hypothetical protein